MFVSYLISRCFCLFFHSLYFLLASSCFFLFISVTFSAFLSLYFPIPHSLYGLPYSVHSVFSSPNPHFTVTPPCYNIPYQAMLCTDGLTG
uniref:Uncharacterized protein n=1 Tax=Rhipicephalus pulchellus TaxID=72859 RepID=L7LWF5_RHIPC